MRTIIHNGKLGNNIVVDQYKDETILTHFIHNHTWSKMACTIGVWRVKFK